MNDVLEYFNAIAWVGSNLLIAYIAIALVVFVLAYGILFDPKATTAGKMIFRFLYSLIGVIGLVYLGTFINPPENREWSAYPGDVHVWRPIVRLIIYGYVAYAITTLAIALGIRKWKPHLIRTAKDLEVVKVRHTTEIPIIKLPKKE